MAISVDPSICQHLSVLAHYWQPSGHCWQSDRPILFSVSGGVKGPEKRRMRRWWCQRAREKKDEQDIMERWFGRVAIVTGASAGIGAGIAQILVENGMKVVGVARRTDPIKDEDVKRIVKWTRENLGGVDVLVNNAGVAIGCPLTDFDTEKFRKVWETNVLGLSLFTRDAIKDMKDRGVNDGHIFHISRQELRDAKSEIKITSISPGLVKTDIVAAASGSQKLADKIFKNPALSTRDLLSTHSDIMERWFGRVAIVTGASAGIGAGIAQILVENGMKVVGVARRTDPIKEMRAELAKYSGELHAIEGDVTKEEDVKRIVKWTRENLGGVDVVMGQKVTNIERFPHLGVYSSTKHAVKTLTEYLRQELRDAKSEIKITVNPTLTIRDVAETLLFALSTPPSVQVSECGAPISIS
ncbi:hypothetical protein B566_EDAN015355 [Ephemera danica]|nr:hypothetical protein B566_EDAN015355 [Ephemera danica]